MQLSSPAHHQASGYQRLHLVRLAVVSLAALALFACSRPAPLVVVVPSDARESFDTALESAPLPEGFEVEIQQSEPAPSEPSPAVTVTAATGPLPEDGRVLEAIWLAPTRLLWEPAEAGAAEPPDTEELLPLSAIELPRVAVSADGRYPDDPGYPYVSHVVVRLDSRATGLAEDDERLAALETWFESLPDLREAPEVSWIGAVGDIMVERGVTQLLDRADGLEYVLGDVLPHLQEVDLMLGNLEGAVTTRGTAAAKTFTFRFHPRVLPRLAEAGFDYVSVVNNHSYDYGEVGFRDTIAHLKESPIATSGSGLTPDEAREPFITTVGNTTVGNTPVHVLSVGAYPVERSGFDGARATAVTDTRAGVLWADPRNPQAQAFTFAAMEDAFGPESLDIVMVHGGAEWATGPSAAQRELYRGFVDRGADLVIGHHSHVTQGMEVYNGALIAYSMGNFIFPGMYLTEYGEESMLLRVGYADAGVRYVELVPVRIDHQTISVDTSEGALDRVLAATRSLNAE
jgi:poly-gamma-glutamate synthesis protein (capsule biosynthesis protein)